MNTKTPVMILQELMQKKGKIPHYDLLHSERSGTHDPRFHYRVTADDVVASGIARSKKDAKHEAAKQALEKFTEQGIFIPDYVSTPTHSAAPNNPPPTIAITGVEVNAIGNLKDFCAENNIPEPQFILESDVGPPHSRLFTYKCAVGQLTTFSTATTMKKAKHLAAHDMLQRLCDAIPETFELEAMDTKEEAVNVTDVINSYKEKSILAGKKKNYSMNISSYPYSIRNIMKEKNLAYDELWKESITNPVLLEEVLEKLELSYTLTKNEENKLAFLLLNSEPEFLVAEFYKNDEDVIPILKEKMVEFLRCMCR